MKSHVKYPCGYEIDVESKWWDFGFSFTQDGECPMHGKDCKAVTTKEA